MDIKTLKEEFAQLHAETNKVVAEAAKAGKFSSEAKEQNDKRYARMDEIKSVLDADKAAAKYAVENDKTEEFKSRNEVVSMSGKKLDEVENFNRFVLTGQASRELYTIDSTTGGSTAGTGVLVPKTLLAPINIQKNRNAIRAALDARGVQTLKSATATAFPLPIADDDANTGATQAENATTQTIAEATVTAKNLLPLPYTSGAEYHSELTLSNLSNPGEWITSRQQARLDLAQEAAWVAKLKTNGTTGVTAALGTGITYQEVLNWEHSLRYVYRRDAVAIVADSFFKLLRGLVDTTGRPLMELDPQNMIQTIHSIPIFVSDSVDAVATTKKVGFLCSASNLYVYDCMSPILKIYNDVPNRPLQRGYELFQIGDFEFPAKAESTFVMG